VFRLRLEACRAGNRIGDIGYAIQNHAEKNGFGVVRELVGHGLGKNHARGSANTKLRKTRKRKKKYKKA
jgi:methionine aminopeptidase, type I (EC 3.4.11.18)